MVEPIQVVLILFIVFALSRVWLRFRESQISVLEFIFWSVLWIVAIIAIAAPKTVEVISQTFGIGRPVDLIVYIAVLLLFYLNFRVYVALDTQQEEITKLVRAVAIKKSKRKK